MDNSIRNLPIKQIDYPRFKAFEKQNPLRIKVLKEHQMATKVDQ